MKRYGLHYDTKAARFFSEYLIRASLFRCTALSICGIAAMGWGFFSGNYDVVGNAIRRYEKNIAIISAQLQQDCMYQREKQALTQSFGALRNNFSMHTTQFSRDSNASQDPAFMVTRKALDCDLILDCCSSLPCADYSWCIKNSFQIQASGSLESIIQFINGAHQDMAARFKNITLEKQTDSSYELRCMAQIVTLKD